MNGAINILRERLEKLTQRCEELCDEVEKQRVVAKHAQNTVLDLVGKETVLRAQLAEAQRDRERIRAKAVVVCDYDSSDCDDDYQEAIDVLRQ